MLRVGFGGEAFLGVCVNLDLEGVAQTGDCFPFFEAEGKTGKEGKVGEDILVETEEELEANKGLLSSNGLLLLFAGVIRLVFSFYFMSLKQKVEKNFFHT